MSLEEGHKPYEAKSCDSRFSTAPQPIYISTFNFVFYHTNMVNTYC